MIDVFLSASVPLPSRDKQFFNSADVLAIREALKALAEVVLPEGRLTCGGHPAITPLLALFVRERGLSKERVTIFQSELFASLFPPELREFADVRMVPRGEELKASLTRMREEMISSREFSSMVIIGGMEGVFEELEIFRNRHPKAVILPIASTGAAAEIVYRQGKYDTQFERNLTYSSLFRRELNRRRPEDYRDL